MLRAVRLSVVPCLIAIAALALLAGCGSSSDDSSSTGSGSTVEDATSATEGGQSGGGGDGVEEATALMEEAMSPDLKFPSPPGQVDPGKGKAGIIACSTLGEGCNIGSEQARAAFLAMGWEASPVEDGKFTPSVQSGLIEKFVREGADAIVINSIDPPTVKAAVESAAAKGIPVVCQSCAPDPAYKGKVVYVGTGGFPDGRTVAYWTIATSDGKAKIVELDDPEFAVVGNRVEGYKTTIEEMCPDCEYEAQNVTAVEISEPGPPWFNGLIASKPKGQLEYIIGPYDQGVAAAAKTAVQRGRTELKMAATGDGNAEALQVIAQGGTPLEAVTITPFLFMGWASADLGMRASIGAPMWDASELPTILVTQENVQEFVGEPGANFAPKVESFEGAFLKSWGK